MVILAIGAHPDDVEFGCYGTLAKLHKKGEQIKILILTSGEISGDKDTRNQESTESANLISAEVKNFGYPDGNIPVDPTIINQIANDINIISPDIIFTLFPEDYHQDHRNVTNIVLSASKHIDNILFYEVPSSFPSFIPNIYYDVTDSFSLKKKALKCHKTQVNKPYLNISEIEGLAKYRAYQINKHNRLFEAFQVFRWIE